ncbi:MarR family winged helix-turn-helix transcriptional regulator [Phycicoccus sonneratiae]|uniref:MarR family transcriptional regulator n=1 Tax=Phycicoccus sonneratiae TaxID=2807628 RepID=A0ABS2CQD0_9MICO|nr:helix-turn-helix domain-containing protein [Phycicoccus sonneraticus]MBM6402093.1 MarR family transcriptional regulator [Phycicoccus sonneraticus]
MTRRPAGLPLAALLGRTQARFVAECEQRVAAAGFPDLRVAHGANVLRHLDRDRGSSSADLVRLSGITKQAVSQQVSYLVGHGYLRVEPDADDARTRRLTLTARGEEGRAVLHATFGAVEREWRRRYGAPVLDALRDALEHVAATDGRP